MADALHVAGVVSAQEARLDDGGLVAVQGPSALDIRTGVMVGPGATALVTGTGATAPMTVNVAAHHWVTARSSAGGPYRGTKEASTTVTIQPAPGSGTRIDVVYEKMQDNTAGLTPPDGAVGELYAVLTGTVGAGKPNLATIPGAEELATVAVSAGATATNGAGVVITNTARLTATRGGLVAVRSDAERDALTPYYGLQIVEVHTGLRRWWDGQRWRYEGDRTVVNNAAARTALTGYLNLEVLELDTLRRYLWNGTAWLYVGGGKPPTTALAMANGWTASTSNPPAVGRDASGRTFLEGWVFNDNTFTPGGGEDICTIPTASLRPVATELRPVSVSIGHAQLQLEVLPSGLIQVAPRAFGLTITANAVWDLGSISWW